MLLNFPKAFKDFEYINKINKMLLNFPKAFKDFEYMHFFVILVSLFFWWTHFWNVHRKGQHLAACRFSKDSGQI
jgi:hypothetical protein